jgi:sigma-B regulation protein RsbU (phosphoserine phosphatase)
MITAVIQELVRNERTKVMGSRMWKLEPEQKSYRLLYEEGTIESIGTGFQISIKDYEVFDQVAKKRTILADETNKTLRRKGIRRYSATGVGEKVPIGRSEYYEYMMAFNADTADNEMRYILNIAGQAMTQILRRRRREAERRSLKSDMEHASELQRRILPQHEYNFGRFDLYGISIPDRIVGGDFFNYYRMEGIDHRLGVAIGDAARKGLPAAVQALFVSGALMMSVEFEAKMTSIIRRINRITYQMFSSDRFLTLFYCELFDTDDGLVLYANAGRPCPLHYKAASGTISSLSVTGTVIGLLPDSNYGIANCNIAPGDVLVLYTDGITEANDGQEEFGEQRLEEIIRKHAGGSSKLICQEILQEVQTYGASSTYSDDKTIVVIKRNN